MRTRSPFLTLCLCVTLLVTSFATGVARGQMAALQVVELCADGQAITVELDIRGNPVDPAHRCPECLALVAAMPPPSGLAETAFGRRHHLILPGAISSAERRQTPALARGPPVLI